MFIADLPPQKPIDVGLARGKTSFSSGNTPTRQNASNWHAAWLAFAAWAAMPGNLPRICSRERLLRGEREFVANSSLWWLRSQLGKLSASPFTAYCRIHYDGDSSL